MPFRSAAVHPLPSRRYPNSHLPERALRFSSVAPRALHAARVRFALFSPPVFVPFSPLSGEGEFDYNYSHEAPGTVSTYLKTNG